MPGASLTLRAAASIATVMVLSVALAVWLNLLRFQETYTALIEQRLDVVLEDAHSDILVGLDMGLRPDTMETLPAILARALDDMPEAIAAQVLDCAGQLVAVASKAGGPAMDLGPIPDAPHWRQRLPDGLRSGLQLTDSFGDCAGVLVLDMTTANQTAALDQVRNQLLRGGGLAMLLTIPALIVVARILRRRRVLMERLCDDLDRASTGADPAPDDGLDTRHALTGSEARMVRAYQRARAALASDTGRPAP